MLDRDGTTKGTWTISGEYVKHVTLRFYGGQVVYEGNLIGEELSGTVAQRPIQMVMEHEVLVRCRIAVNGQIGM